MAVVSVSGGQTTLIPGQILQGQILPAAADGLSAGLLAIGTAQSGTVVVQAKGASADLAGQAQTVTVQVVAGPDGTVSLRLLAVDGQAVGRGLPGAPSLPGLINPLQIDTGAAGQSGTAAPALQPSSADPGAAATEMPSPGPRADVPQGFVATVIRSATDAGTAVLPSLPGGRTVSLPSPLAVGTTLTLRIRDVIAAPAPTVPSPPESPGEISPAGQSVQAQPALAEGAAGDIPDGAAVPRPGQSPPLADELPAAASIPDGESVPSPSSASPAPALAGRVTTLVAGQRAVVETVAGTLSMPASPALKLQSLVLFDMVGQPSPPDPTAQTGGGWSQPGPQMAQSLGEALAVLASAGQEADAQRLLAAIPQLDARLAASMSVFLKAVDKGSSRELFDERDALTEVLGKAGKKSVAERLTQALEGVEKEAEEPVADGQWRAFTMPLWNPFQGEVDPIRLYVRQQIASAQDQGSGQGGKEPGQEHRFVVDVTLSRLGRLQMDGLVLRADKRFDLILRMEQPFTAEMRRDIAQLFTLTTEAVGVKGGVSFQGGRFLSFPPGQTKAPPTAITI